MTCMQPLVSKWHQNIWPNYSDADTGQKVEYIELSIKSYQEAEF